MSNAIQDATTALRECLPQGIPLAETVNTARYIKKNTIDANVTFFDGRMGEVQIVRIAYGSFSGWSIQWLSLGGGAVNWNGTCWERVPDLAAIACKQLMFL